MYDLLRVTACAAVLKEHTKVDAATKLAAEAYDIDKDAFDAKTHVVTAFFEDANEADEADSLACWEDCIVLASGEFNKCDDFCASVEQCCCGKCISSPARAYTSYNVLNCILEDSGWDAKECTYTGSLESLE